MGQLVNQAELGRDVALPQPTVHRYLNLLETSYLLVRLPAYVVNRTKRLIKSPKVYWGDTGVALHLTQEEEPRGAHLENLVLHDLLTWRDSRLDRAEVFYWRTTVGEEVDFVIEAGDRLLPIEVKATAPPRLRDITNLRTFPGRVRGKGQGRAAAARRRDTGLDCTRRAGRPLVGGAVRVVWEVGDYQITSCNWLFDNRLRSAAHYSGQPHRLPLAMPASTGQFSLHRGRFHRRRVCRQPAPSRPGALHRAQPALTRV